MQQLEQKLATKLRYVRVGYDNTFDYFALGVKDGVVTVEGQDRTGVGRDEALAEIANMPGVKDVIDNVSVAPVSISTTESGCGPCGPSIATRCSASTRWIRRVRSASSWRTDM